jgi:tRNA threonylcarbamoyladenosine biosynthesis protein TsaB
MIILSIETSGTTASVALTSPEKIIAEFTINNSLTHSQTLMPMVEQLLKISQTDKTQINLLACSSGPGSFTGLRIGAAAAKGLAFGLNLKIVPVSTLHALAYNISQGGSRDDSANPMIIVPIMDARRNQVYTAIYDKSYKTLQDPIACDIDHILNLTHKLKQKTNNPAIFLGDAVRIYKDKIHQSGFKTAAEHHLLQRAASVALIARQITHKAISAEQFELTYIRQSQAEREAKIINPPTPEA